MKSKNSSLPENAISDKYELKQNYNLQNFLHQLNLNPKKLKKIEALFQGAFHSNIPGSGFDFNEIREYQAGDDLRHISWSATARTGGLQTKVFNSEKEVFSYFLIDISSSMFSGNKFSSFLKLVAFLLKLSCNFSEKIGGVYFSDEIKYLFPFLQASTHANIMFETLISYINKSPNEKNILSQSYLTNFVKPLEYTRGYFSRKGFVFVISDLLNLNNWEKSFYDISQKQNLYLFQIYDPVDFELPKSGFVTLIDPETKERFTVNTDSKLIRESYKNNMLEKQARIKSFVQSTGVNHILIYKEDFE